MLDTFKSLGEEVDRLERRARELRQRIATLEADLRAERV